MAAKNEIGRPDSPTLGFVSVPMPLTAENLQWVEDAILSEEPVKESHEGNTDEDEEFDGFQLLPEHSLSYDKLAQKLEQHNIYFRSRRPRNAERTAELEKLDCIHREQTDCMQAFQVYELALEGGDPVDDLFDFFQNDEALYEEDGDKEEDYKPLQMRHHRNHWFDHDKSLAKLVSIPGPDRAEGFHIRAFTLKAIQALGNGLSHNDNWAVPQINIVYGEQGRDMRLAELHCACYGAASVETSWIRHKAMELPAEDFLGKIQAVAIAFDGKLIETYACYAVAAPSDALTTFKEPSKYPEKIAYHQVLLKTTSLRTQEGFSQAYSSIWNLRRWAIQRSIEVRDAVNAYFPDDDYEQLSTDSEDSGVDSDWLSIECDSVTAEDRLALLSIDSEDDDRLSIDEDHVADAKIFDF